jgi:predicted dehydrogenase
MHFRAWAACLQGHYVAAVDVNEPAARARAQEFGLGASYTDLRQAIEREKPDFVDIMTRPDTHRPLAQVAADAGCHVLCQKPFAPSMDEGRAIAGYAESKGVRIMVAEMWRWMPAIRELKKLLEAAPFGRVVACHMVDRNYGMNRFEPVNPKQPYFRDYTKLVTWEMGIHHVDALRFLFGDIDTVYAVQWKLNPVIAGEDACVAHFHHAAGIESFLDMKWTHRGGDPVSPYVHIECDRGTMQLSRDWSAIWLRPIDAEPRQHEYTRPENGYQKAFDACVNDFAQSIATGAPMASDARDNLQTLAATLGCYDSSKARAPVGVGEPA